MNRATRNQKLLCGAALTLALLGAPRGALAACFGQVSNLAFPTLSVVSDGSHYVDMNGIGAGWQGHLSIDCGVNGRVKEWEVYPKITAPGQPTKSFQTYRSHKSYPALNRPKKVEKNVGEIFPNVFVEDYAVEACNRKADALRQQGKSDYQIFSQVQNVQLDLGVEYNADLTGTADWVPEAFFGETATIVCEKYAFAPPQPGPGHIGTDIPFALDSASLTIIPDHYEGPCEKDLTLLMTVRGNVAGTFEARVESTEGWKSTKFVFKTNEFEQSSGLWVRDFSSPLTVPLEKPAGGGGGHGGGVSGPGSFQVQPPPGDDPFPGGGGAGSHAVGGVTAQDPGPNVHQQSLRLAAKANGKTVYSDWKFFRVVCDPKPALPPATTSFLPGGNGPGRDDEKPDDPHPQPQPGSKPQPQPQPQSGDKPASKPKPGKSEAQKPAASGGGQNRQQPAGSSLAARPQRPDLLVARAQRGNAGPRAIEVLVENRGQGDAPSSQAALICARPGGGAETWRVSVPAIPAGARKWVRTTPSGTTKLPRRMRGCEIRLDPDDALAEAREDNNRFQCASCAPSGQRKR